MFVVSHACIPIIAANAVNLFGLALGGKSTFTGKELLLIGVAGMLPDLLDPHLLLVDRLASWTHTLWFALATAAAVGGLVWSRIIKNAWLGLFVVAAVALHIACDAITGGVNLLWPYDYVVGRYVIGSEHWLELDLITGPSAGAGYVAVRIMQRRAVKLTADQLAR